jgi:4-hydroxysphinganine ceramide fatty acyl 2-hydroxylase
MAVSKTVHIFTEEDVSKHNTSSSCWITRAGKIYDVTSFLADHPGGDDLIVKYAGKDVEKIMKDATEHEHSESAYDMMDEFLIGKLGTQETTVKDGSCCNTTSRLPFFVGYQTFFFLMHRLGGS